MKQPKTLIQLEYEQQRDELLRKAVFKSDIKSVFYMLKHGADPNAKSAHGGDSASELAEKEGNSRIITLIRTVNKTRSKKTI